MRDRRFCLVSVVDAPGHDQGRPVVPVRGTELDWTSAEPPWLTAGAGPADCRAAGIAPTGAHGGLNRTAAGFSS